MYDVKLSGIVLMRGLKKIGIFINCSMRNDTLETTLYLVKKKFFIFVTETAPEFLVIIAKKILNYVIGGNHMNYLTLMEYLKKFQFHKIY